MAIVKGNYTRSRIKIKATIRYIVHRPTRTDKRITRALFGQDGALDRKQAYQLIDQAPKGTFFFRLVISPDAKREDSRRDLNLKALTRTTLQRLEERLGRSLQFIAAEHNDPTEKNRHVHAIVLVKLKKGERLNIKDYQALREAAANAAYGQRLVLDRRQSYQPERFIRPPLIASFSRRVQPARQYRAKLRPPKISCPDCGIGQQMYRLKSGIHWCPTCHLKLTPQWERIKELQLEL